MKAKERERFPVILSHKEQAGNQPGAVRVQARALRRISWVAHTPAPLLMQRPLWGSIWGLC